jgi:transcriptional regulator with XRE-family HTH domain
LSQRVPSPSGVAVRKLRLEHGLTLRELGARAGVDNGIISRLETGAQSSARRPTLEKLAAALEVDVSVLTGDQPASPVMGVIPAIRRDKDLTVEQRNELYDLYHELRTATLAARATQGSQSCE